MKIDRSVHDGAVNASRTQWRVEYTLVIFTVYRQSLKMTQYKILQNQDFQSCILSYYKRSWFENSSKYRIYASIARNGRLFWQTSSFCYFLCVCIQYSMLSWVNVSFCGYDISTPLATESTDGDVFDSN